jgi:ferric-dicitrate binding protein FerR (iron transport regulator)
VVYYAKGIDMKLSVLILAVIVRCCFADAPVHSEGAARDVLLENGVSVRMEARSSGTIYADHAVLELGAARVSHFGGYQVQAGDWLIEAEAPNSQAVIRVEKNTVEVASLGGAVRVSDGGAMLTRVTAGSRMAFQNSGATPGSKHKGPSETKVIAWVIVAVAAAALAIGLTAVAQGKSL